MLINELCSSSLIRMGHTQPFQIKGHVQMRIELDLRGQLVMGVCYATERLGRLGRKGTAWIWCYRVSEGGEMPWRV